MINDVPAGLKKSLITTELFRTYIFPDGFEYTISGPAVLYVKSKAEGDSHRIVDDAGMVHYVPAGWKIVRWQPRPGAPSVEF